MRCLILLAVNPLIYLRPEGVTEEVNIQYRENEEMLCGNVE